MLAYAGFSCSLFASTIILYIVEVIDEFYINLAFIKLKLRLTWKPP